MIPDIFIHFKLHIFITVSLPPVAITPYFLWNFTVEMKCSWASTFFFYLPYVNYHTLIVLSSDAVYKYFPVGCKAKPLTQLSCPINVCNNSPLWAANNLTSLSLELVKIKTCW